MRSQRHLLQENRSTSGTEVGDREVRIVRNSGTTAIGALVRVLGNYANGQIVRATVDTDFTSPVEYTFTAVGAQTPAAMATGLAAAINAAAHINATASDGTITVLAAGSATVVTVTAASFV